MMLITKEIERQLRANAGIEGDHKPVLKLFNPNGSETWLFTEMDEDGILYGLADMGWGCPELGYSSLEEIKATKVGFGLGIERDMYFTAKQTLSGYAEEAKEKGRIAA